MIDYEEAYSQLHQEFIDKIEEIEQEIENLEIDRGKNKIMMRIKSIQDDQEAYNLLSIQLGEIETTINEKDKQLTSMHYDLKILEENSYQWLKK